jgi:hypothetical protein
MLSTDVIVNNFAQTLIAGIQSNIRTKRVTEYGSMNASGTMADSLKYKWDGKKLVIFSTEKYFTVLETGRGPTSSSAKTGSPTLRELIEIWIDQKPVALQDITKESLAYLIARDIHKNGSKLYQRGGNSGVISDYINEKYVTDNLTEKLFQAQIEIITNQFLKAG